MSNARDLYIKARAASPTRFENNKELYIREHKEGASPTRTSGRFANEVFVDARDTYNKTVGSKLHYHDKP